MLLVKLTLGIHHLRFHPKTKLNPSLCCHTCERGNTIGQFRAVGLPVAKSGIVVVTWMGIAKPTVVEQKHIHSQLLCFVHEMPQFLLIEVESRILPVVEKSETIAHAILQLIATCPIVKTPLCRLCAIVAEGEHKLGSGEHLTALQLIVGGIRIDGRNET